MYVIFYLFGLKWWKHILLDCWQPQWLKPRHAFHQILLSLDDWQRRHNANEELAVSVAAAADDDDHRHNEAIT